MMVFINDCYKANSLYRPYVEGFVKMFSCVCPFVGEEMWELLGHKESIAYAEWPKCDASKLVKDEIKMAVSVNGKTRDVMDFSKDVTEEEAIAAAKANPKVASFLEGKTIKKVIFVKGRILNLVVA